MTTTVIAAIVMTPIVLLPVAFVAYLTIGGVYGAVRARTARRAATPA